MALFQNILTADDVVADDHTWPGDCDHLSRSFASDLLRAQPGLRLGRRAGGYATLRAHSYFSAAAAAGDAFGWPRLEARALAPPYAPPAPGHRLDASNFSPEVLDAPPAAPFDGDQEIFAAWSDQAGALDANAFDPDALHMGRSGDRSGDGD